MAVRPISACLWGGMLMPAMRAIWVPQPCRCLWRGSVQITRTTPLRRITLQLRHIFLTDAATFMSSSVLFGLSSLRPEHDPRARQVVRRQLDRHLVAGQDADVVHAHLPGDVAEHHMAVLELHAKRGVGEVLEDLPL